MAGVKCGYVHVQTLAEGDGDARVIHTRSHMEMSIKRFNQSVHTIVTVDEYEKPDGTLLRVEARIHMGGMPKTVTAKVNGRRLDVTIETAGVKRRTTLPLEKPLTGSQDPGDLTRRLVVPPRNPDSTNRP